LARETEEVGLLAQRPVQARRRDLKRIGVIDKILHVEEVTQLFARSLTIAQSQAATLVEIEAKDPPTYLPTKLDLHQFEPQLLKEGECNLLHSLDNRRTHGP
jgi:hypothetical protein